MSHLPPRSAPTARPAAGAFVLALLLGACSDGDGGAERALWELERMAFVPAASTRVFGTTGAWSDCSIPEPILVDRYELTRSDWEYYLPNERPAVGFDERIAGFAPDQLDWPVYVDQSQAMRIAEQRGMRLLTAREWIHVALGRRSFPYPWGTERRTSVANTLELGMGRPLSVGTFESGRSEPFGCYDMLGNVWEWVQDRAPPYAAFTLSREWRLGESRGKEGALQMSGDGLVSVFGGSFLSSSRRTFGTEDGLPVFHCMTLDRRTLTPSIGVRHGADAGTYLPARAALLSRAEGAQGRVQSIGRRWARMSGREYVLPFLDALSSAHPDEEALAWLAKGAAAD